MGMSNFAADNNRLAEMEFYLIEELDFHLIVFHPYRALMQLCGRDGGEQAGGEEGRESRRKMLEMDDHSFQMAWSVFSTPPDRSRSNPEKGWFRFDRFIINDTFRSSLCLVHPPHLIALASIYLALSMNPPRSLIAAFTPLNNDPSASTASTSSSSHDAAPNTGVASRTRRRGSADASTNASNSGGKPLASSSAGATASAGNGKPGGQTDALTFLASLEIDQTILLEIIQEIISLYELWSILESSSSPPNNAAGSASPAPSSPNPTSNAANPSGRGTRLEGNNVDQKLVGLIKRMQESRMRELREERSRAAQVGASASATAGSNHGKRG